MVTKSSLAIILSQLKVFEDPKTKLEQYPIDSEIAADILWSADLNKDINGKVIADLGCGTGILGIGALLLGAKGVYFIDEDQGSIGIAQKNLNQVKGRYEIKGKAVFVKKDIKDFQNSVHAVIQNPPFGVQTPHVDKAFLETAFSIARVIYSLHKIESEKFIEQVSRDNGFRVTHIWKYSLPLKATQAFHTRRIYKVRVGCFRLEKST